VLQGLQDFREHLGGQLTVTLLQEIGCGLEVHNMEPALVVEAIHSLHRRALSRVRPGTAAGHE
jgi:3-dehydroquinate synthase